MSGLATAGALVRLVGVPGAVLSFAKKLPGWVWIAIAAIAAVLFGWWLHTSAEKRAFNAAFNAGYQIEWRRHQTDIASWRRANAEAEARNRSEVQRIEANAKTITETQNVQIQTAAARYSDLAARYARLHAAPSGGAPAVGGDAGKAGLPGASGPAGDVAADPAFTVVPSDDLQRCATLYTLAKGWQDWWNAQAAAWPKPPG